MRRGFMLRRPTATTPRPPMRPVMPHRRPRTRCPEKALQTLLPLLLCGAVAGCAPTPPPEPSGPPLVGAYTGTLVADGQTFTATMRLQAEAAARSSGILRVSPPVDLEGRVSAVAVGDLLRIDVSYTGADGCQGRIVGILDVDQDGGVVEGPVTLTDCADPVAGHVRFRRARR